MAALPDHFAYIVDHQLILYPHQRFVQARRWLKEELEDSDKEPLLVVNKLPFNPLKDEALFRQSMHSNDGVQFSHTLEEQVGGQLRAGLVLTDLFEDSDPSILGQYCPLFIATRAVKP